MGNDMNFEEFKKYMRDNIAEHMGGEYANAEVNLHEVIKNNDTVLDGLDMRLPEDMAAPTIYLNDFYDDYSSGRKSAEEIMDDIGEIFANTHGTQFDVENLNDFEAMKSQIIPKLINVEKNTLFLENKPFTAVEDLAVIYSVTMVNDERGIAGVTVNDDLMSRWGVEKELLHETALNNLSEKYPMEIKSMTDTLVDLMAPQVAKEQDISIEEAREIAADLLPPIPTESSMYVVRNSIGINGAANILCEGAMDKIAERIGCDYYVLPSSVHELIVVPNAEGNPPLSELEAMVKEVNATQVDPQDRLSDHVYYYDVKEREFMRADKIELRQALRDEVSELLDEMNAAKENVQRSDSEVSREKISMKEKLPEMKEKASELAKNEHARERAEKAL